MMHSASPDDDGLQSQLRTSSSMPAPAETAPLSSAVLSALCAVLSELVRSDPARASGGNPRSGAAELDAVLSRLTRERDLAGHLLDAAGYFTDVHFGPVGPIVMAQRTARAAVEMVWFCYASIGGPRWNLESVGSQVHYGFRTPLLSLEQRPLVLLAVALAYQAALRFWGLGAADELAVELPFAESPELSAACRRVLGERARFAAGRAGLCFPAARLDLERHGADAEFAARLRDYALARNVGRPGASSWVWRVESVLKAAQSGAQQLIQHVARELRVSSRTLRRRLGEEGTTFTEICTRVRQERALQMLVETDIPLKEIGRIVGYADHNSFRRAIQLAFGRAPLQIRQSGLPR